MRRFLILFAIFGGALFLLRRLMGRVAGGTQRSSAAGSDSGSTRLVRDAVCNTFIPKDRALVHRAPPEIYYFCSVECRTRYLTDVSKPRGGSAALAS